jgi:hypothetical protein
MIEGYSKIITSNNKKDLSVVSLLNKAVMSNEFRFRAHHIEISKSYLDLLPELKVSCVENIMLGVILNIFDNSIYWLEKYRITEKKIYITAKDY